MTFDDHPTPAVSEVEEHGGDEDLEQATDPGPPDEGL